MPRDAAFTFNLKGGAAYRPYEAADLNTAHATFTVRDTVSAPRKAIAPDRWAFGTCPTGRDSLAASGFDICYFDRFDPDRIYELIYAAKDPIVMGLGHAATRDVASFLRNETATAANPLAGRIRRIYATGASQTGGFLRDFIYLGFNEDEAHRRVFDGVIPTIAGTDRVFINVRFADPNVYSGQEDRHDFLQNSHPPFAYAVVTDPLTGIHDGILKRPATDPAVFQVDSATEFWQLRGSLNVVDAKGHGIALPPNLRLYFVSSTSHGFGIGGLLAPTPASNTRCAWPAPSGANDLARPLLAAMDAWVDSNVEPPPSNYPRIEDGTLVTVEDARAAFPAIPGLRFPASPNPLERLEYGPEFNRYGGVITVHPPRVTIPCSCLRPTVTDSTWRVSISCRYARRSGRPPAGTCGPRRRARRICAACPGRTCRLRGPPPSALRPATLANRSKSAIARTKGSWKRWRRPPVNWCATGSSIPKMRSGTSQLRRTAESCAEISGF